MLTVGWVNYTSCNKRGPNKKYVEYLVGLSKLGKQQGIRFVAIFPEYNKEDAIYEIFKENQVEYYLTPICNALYFNSVNQEVKNQARQTLKNNIESLKVLCQKIKVDILVANCTLVTEVAFVAKELGIKYVLFIRGILNPVNFPKDYQDFTQFREIEKIVLENANLIVTQSEYTAKLWGLDHQFYLHYKVIPLGCQLNTTCQPLELEKGPLKVLLLSGLEANKNQGMLLETAALLKSRGKKVIFNIYGIHGDEVYKNWVESEIVRQRLEEYIHIHSYEANIQKLIETHHMMLMTSKLESFGATAIEAMQSYRPVISTKSGGPEEIIVNGETGILIENNASKELAGLLESLMSDTGRLREMGIKGRKRWEEKYSQDKVLQEWVTCLKEIPYLKTNSQKATTQKTIKNQGRLKHWLIVAKNLNNSSLRVGLVNTLEELKRQNKLEFRLANHKNASEEVDWADVVLFVRLAEPENLDTFKKVLEKKKPCFYYVDDALFAIPEDVIAHAYYNTDKKRLMEYYIKNSIATITCSPWLGEAYEKAYNCLTQCLHPTVAIPPRYYPHNKKERLIIGFAGGIDYTRLLEEKKDVFLEIYRKYKEVIQFEICGPNCSFAEAIHATMYHYTDYESYERLMEKRAWDIGLAFLPDTPFYNNKYYNKFLEYSRFGIAGVYADIPLYRRIIQPEINGLLALATTEDWIKKIEQLIHNKSMREKIATNAYYEVGEKFSPQAGAKAFEALFKTYLE
ncbi:hypothetical protein CS063_07625 [Sporanaerobium hydrogeniformans]|uniref:Uncharacterized protein n=1 Tax=Sporanaerobium hydrogeniformans TaxID=3072179 RepID=A0AC61DDH6_9FIRM|nr:glycosyltransferase [Sporanaerobium hydrogeniformans]PHV70885.1 hypothetical protein CS063_07625 [Sporanaerobium hydrogeniformans]